MDRTIVYPASIPQDTDILSLNRNSMIALGYLAQAALGATTVADGLACTPTQPASMSVLVGPGSITSVQPVDATPYGSLGTDTSEQIVKMGINHAGTSFTLSAPTNTNTAINYLIEAAFGEADTDPVVLPYYNAANPTQPYSGPGNGGTAQNTVRLQNVQLRLVAGAAGPAGLQTTPTPDAGWFGLWVITVFNGMTAVGAGAISVYPSAPFLPFKLPQLRPGHSAIAVIASTQQWLPPFGVQMVRLRMVGGGGGGGAGGGAAGGGGGGGGYVEGYYPVSPGVTVACTVGAGGAPGGGGGASSFGALASATGGAAGASGAGGTGGVGGTPGIGAGTGLVLPGLAGQNGLVLPDQFGGGDGGGTLLGQGAFGPRGANGANVSGAGAVLPGAGGAGGTGTGAGGAGAPGLILLEY